MPFSQMLRLHSAARSRVTEWIEFPDSQHMDAYMTNQELYWPALRDFLSTHVTVGQRLGGSGSGSSRLVADGSGRGGGGAESGGAHAADTEGQFEDEQ